MDLRVGRVSRIRVLSRPEQGIRALVDQAAQAEAFAGRVMTKLHPGLAWLYGSRRRVATAGVALLTAWLFLHVTFGANGMVIYRLKRAEYQNLQKEINGLQDGNSRYSERIKALKTDPKTIEKEAREQLHYARPGEVIYVAPTPTLPQTPSTDRARK